MEVPLSSLAAMCNTIADFLQTGLDKPNTGVSVMLGTPAEAAKDTQSNHVNLFFHRFEPSGFGPFTASDEVWLIRMHCLVTAFGISGEDNQTSAGENELRMLGEVMRIFHETPVLESDAFNGEKASLQVVFNPLSSDEINHIWSTQGDITYHPSVAYEMALGLVVPQQRIPTRPLVGGIGAQAYARMDAIHAGFGGAAEPPPVKKFEVDIGKEDWTARICLVAGGECAQSVVFAVGSPQLAAFVPTVWIAGDTASNVTLRWEVWEAGGWKIQGPSLVTTPIGTGIDPDAIPAGPLPTLALPFDDHAGQAVLYAVREYTRAFDGVQVQVRSNPLLVTLF